MGLLTWELWGWAVQDILRDSTQASIRPLSSAHMYTRSKARIGQIRVLFCPYVSRARVPVHVTSTYTCLYLLACGGHLLSHSLMLLDLDWLSRVCADCRVLLFTYSNGRFPGMCQPFTPPSWRCSCCRPSDRPGPHFWLCPAVSGPVPKP